MKSDVGKVQGDGRLGILGTPKNTVAASTTTIPRIGGINVSKHAPGEVNLDQIALATRQAAEIATRKNEKEKRERAKREKIEMGEPEEPKRDGGEMGKSRWSKILGEGFDQE